ncbi:lasso peptide biosynthesis PqqD family chaperone [Paenibacillus sp. HB172176]|uniref:lasso peptide biosynthesis PqqD family chaperone n=1 Tax=Paenibacillus sp. HB172176 TaxID=2493690 RepID=UPI00143C20C5|nr:lasso peptide biosynthesis PqqD family chaperone [Paenibacillus sp. HB172176]
MNLKQEVLFQEKGRNTLSLYLNVTQSKDIIVSDMGDEKVILSIENGKYYNLGAMGGRIWELANEPIMVGQIINTLLDEYDIDRATCESQVFNFFAQLSEERLIVFSV